MQAWWQGCRQPGKVILSMPMSRWQQAQVASGSVAPAGGVAEVIAAICIADRLVNPSAAVTGEMIAGTASGSDWWWKSPAMAADVL